MIMTDLTQLEKADLLASFGWDVLNHMYNSHDLTPSEFFVFSCLKTSQRKTILI